MSNRPALAERPLGARYRLDQPDGTWWELGWDRPLGTFYAQHYSPEPYDPFTADQPLAWHGTRLFELRSIDALASSMNVALPDEIAQELESDAAAYPHTVDPPFLRIAEALQNAAAADASGAVRRTLPAGPVAAVLADLRGDPYLAADDLANFARGLGIDGDLACDVVAGSVEELDVERIAHVCEALRCSPYDLWGPTLGREILDVYGPERWPRHIEPLDDGRPLIGNDTFIRRRLEQQAADVVSIAEQRPPASMAVIATRFRQTAVLAVDEHGHATRVTDTLQRADPTTEYHFAFHRLAEPETVPVAMTPSAFAAGCPAGHDATPALVHAAEALERRRPGTDMFRFVDPVSGAEQWLGRDTPFDPWQTWDDPRRYYPGDPADVLHDSPGHLADPQPHAGSVGELNPDPEFDGVNLDF